jgi:hypothetical protein
MSTTARLKKTTPARLTARKIQTTEKAALTRKFLMAGRTNSSIPSGWLTIRIRPAAASRAASNATGFFEALSTGRHFRQKKARLNYNSPAVLERRTASNMP